MIFPHWLSRLEGYKAQKRIPANSITVIPGWSEGPDPEDSGFASIGPRIARTRWMRPGMT
jgi:hypothetical protein